MTINDELDQLDRALEAGLICQDKILELTLSDEDVGVCLACGAEQDGCEPDARQYTCEECDQKAVYGAEEILMMLPLR